MRSIIAALASMSIAVPAMAAQTDAPKAAASETTVEPVAEGLVHPWGMQFLPDGRMLVTERPGRMRIVGADGRLSDPVQGVPEVFAQRQGGLLDVALARDFTSSRTIFFSFSEPREGGGNGTAVARARLVEAEGAARLEGVEVIFRQQPSFSNGLHFGSRIVIAPDGKLFVTLGERFQMDYSQDLSRHWGKVVRINPDGSAPQDNPFAGRDNARPEIWSYGHRNPQAAGLHPETGELWIVDHGPRGGDEVNAVRKGQNYGWPVINYGTHYSGESIPDKRQGMVQPLYYWVPSIAPSGMAFYTAGRVQQWRGNLFVGALAGRHLARLVLDGVEVKAEEQLLTGLGERIRDVEQGPDGAIYVLTDSPQGRVLRVLPRERS
ncbi:MAG: sorbosone dehydrogenase family protein [Hyphomicrobiaceae bacterium]|nr:sorbosone dehydrogenase family protein [Hyphomicrobiaceae bacterium]